MSADYEALWRDPANWRRGMAYYCKADPRVIVPKRNPWGGWTVNFAHPQAWTVIAGSVVIAAGPVVALLVLGVTDPRVYWAAIVGSIAVLIAVSYELSGRAEPQALPGVIIATSIVVLLAFYLCRVLPGDGFGGRAWMAIGAAVAGLSIIGLLYRTKGRP
jgi:uncharacterized membrane protein